MRFKQIILGTCLTASILTMASGAWALDWGESEGEIETIAVKVATEYQKGGYELIKTGELKKWLDEKKDMLVVDTMPYEKSFKKRHVPGAVQFEFPIEEMTAMDDKTKAAYAELLGPNKERTIVTYCGFTKCGRSHNGAMWAAKLGYKNVYRVPGGIKAWEEADFPVEKVED